MTTLNKIILRTAVEGLVWTIVVFSYGLGIFAMSFPGVMANFYDTVGNRRLSAVYHSRVYQRNPSPENLFFAFSRNMDIRNDGRVIRYGIKFFDELDANERDRIVTDVDAHLVTRAGYNTLAIQTATNTEDRLRRGFIRALLNRGYDTRARSAFVSATAVVNLERPSLAIMEFPRNVDSVMRNHFLSYFNRFSLAFYHANDLSPATILRAQFFIDHAMLFFNYRFGE